jgi:CelD/BcsL family acetyltransferase involved in cellulose biosynthesis
MTEVLEINDIQTLATLRLTWSALFAQTRQASFFQTLDWLLVYWKHFGHSQRLRVLLVHAQGKPIGILPLVVRVRKRGPLTMRVLCYPLDDWGAFYGPIGPNPTATLHLGLAHIARTPREWDYLELGWTASELADAGRTPAAMQAAGLPSTSPSADVVALIELNGSWDEYARARGHKWRVNYRRSERKLAQQGQMRHVRHRPAPAADGDGDPRWDLYEACELVAARSWQANARDGSTLSHPRVRDYLRETHEFAARLGMLDMNVLYLDERPAAFIYNYRCQGNLFGLRRGHDPAIDGAGTVLLGQTIRDSYARGDRVFNLGAGYLEAKRHWLTRTVRGDRFCHFPWTSIKAQGIRMARTLRMTSATGRMPREK